MLSRESLIEAASEYKHPGRSLAYGTAGFRNRYDLPMDYIFFRMGLLACLRSSSASDAVIGLMITASHNAEIDNGVKLVDTDGGMLLQAWEGYAEAFVNATTIDGLYDEVNKLMLAENIADKLRGGVVLLGRDTRPHSANFAACAKKGIELLGGTCYDLGEVTTPQLHFVVKYLNETKLDLASANPSFLLSKYFDTIVGGYKALLSTGSRPLSEITNNIVVDAAAGVGARALESLRSSLSSHELLLSVETRNDIGSSPVNENCGAEYVQKGQVPPRGLDPSTLKENQLLCSFDGDADRIVFHSYLHDQNNKWILIDGDKIAALLALLLIQELRESGVANDFQIGVVQTAYANGSSTSFLRKHDVPVVMAKTGVKFLHHKALHYDVGVYFEANGHGTVLFSKKFVEASLSWGFEGREIKDLSRSELARYRLKACVDVINQAVGDALSDMMACLAALEVLNLSHLQWSELYQDFPSRQLKVPVTAAFKATITCSEDETRVITPAALQTSLDNSMESLREFQGRCFVRPSGTEDVVRVYAEATTQEMADDLANRSLDAIKSML